MRYSARATLRRTWGGPSHPGFLAAYPETQFIALESMASYDSKVWTLYYTAHKILKGLPVGTVNLAVGLREMVFESIVLGRLSVGDLPTGTRPPPAVVAGRLGFSPALSRRGARPPCVYRY
ncbi:hypothetical protein [Streptomyces europaeiscabiei]|uniref:hypothetical protein n=1 Tax=Streptomyces europaeiscabiei TaxID=146819 RepID=UPI0029B91523|nr:hypothetical protein [Streptomyces europaeiscabiei]MDX3862204.1 hypothetical protein [Streptomyces europaeiscabiei]MDX3876726.1 hypothetical protein [Streptomyces europaeiscabiei]